MPIYKHQATSRPYEPNSIPAFKFEMTIINMYLIIKTGIFYPYNLTNPTPPPQKKTYTYAIVALKEKQVTQSVDARSFVRRIGKRGSFAISCHSKEFN